MICDRYFEATTAPTGQRLQVCAWARRYLDRSETDPFHPCPVPLLIRHLLERKQAVELRLASPGYLIDRHVSFFAQSGFCCGAKVDPASLRNWEDRYWRG